MQPIESLSVAAELNAPSDALEIDDGRMTGRRLLALFLIVCVAGLVFSILAGWALWRGLWGQE